ncbi:hypothetical protein ZIOFF_004943 [Zingiber officinale]|uniref:Protein kinase domain-containing protein n=1 Tax=Zingiber officinale TaxID=94328 RepID=A0A8J5IBN0_ZINOF|nr:hypothetical protein ZIOFF_004943 [Zingiber officinale]
MRFCSDFISKAASIGVYSNRNADLENGLVEGLPISQGKVKILEDHVLQAADRYVLFTSAKVKPYLQDNDESNWYVLLKASPRDILDMNLIEEDAYTSSTLLDVSRLEINITENEPYKNITSNSSLNSSQDLYVKERIDDDKIDKKKGHDPSKLNLVSGQQKPKELERNEFGQSIGDNSVKYASFLGCMIKEFVSYTLDGWNDVDEEVNNRMWNCLQMNYNIEEWEKKSIFQKLAKLWLDRKSKLQIHIREANVGPMVSRNLSLLNSEFMDQNQWKLFVKRTLSAAFQLALCLTEDAEGSSIGGLTHGGRGDRVAFHLPDAAMAADLERGRYVVVVLFLCCSMILGLQSIAAERPLGLSTAQAGSNRSDLMEDDKPPLLGRLVNSLPKNGSHSHAWPVFLVTTYKSGSIITSALTKHKMSCFGCCEENDNNRTAASGGPYVASHSAGNDGAYLSANTPSKGAQTVKPQPIAVPAIPVDEIREITKNFGDEALIWEGSFGRVYFGVLKNERSTVVSMVSRLKHENVVELVGYSVEGNLRLLAYKFATMGSLHDILHGRKGVKGAQPGPVLSWLQRVKIAVRAAKGLEYLHEKAQPHIIHRDIKSKDVRKEPTIEKPTPISAPPKDAERQLSKKELKKKEMAELDALLHEMGIANKDSNTAQNETADKKQLEQSSEGEKKESIGAPSENRILKKKKSKKEKSLKEQEEHDQK